MLNCAASRENLSSVVPTRSGTNRAAQPHNLAKGLKFRISKEEALYYLFSENKGTGIAQLIRAFVFAYAKIFFFLMTRLISSLSSK